MATTNGTTKDKMSKQDRELVQAGLEMYIASAARQAKAAKSDTIRDVYQMEAARATNLMHRFMNGELEL